MKPLPLAVVSFLAALAAGTADAQEVVSFPTPDGGIVYGDIYGSGDRAVVLAHGGRFTKESWATQAPILAEAGFRVLAIDFRGRGKSRGGPREAADDDGTRYDVLAAVRYLREHGVSSVALVGASFGAAAAAEAAVEAPEAIDRLVLLAHSPIEHPERLPGHTLFIVASGDTTASGAPRLLAIRDQFARAPEPKSILVLAGTAHAQFLFETAEGERLLREIIRFLKE